MLESQVNTVLDHELQRLFLKLSNSSSLAKAFAREAYAIPSKVLVRHTLEHVFRIEMFRDLDRTTTRLLERESTEVAILWRRYSRSEAVHDRYFRRDLENLGLRTTEIAMTQPFDNTLALGEYMAHSLQVFGPLPVVLYSYWVEHSSQCGTPPILARMEAEFGPASMRGAKSHHDLDKNQDHTALVSSVLTTLIGDHTRLFVAVRLLERITEFIRLYFADLESWGKNCTDNWSLQIFDSPNSKLIVTTSAMT